MSSLCLECGKRIEPGDGVWWHSFRLHADCLQARALAEGKVVEVAGRDLTEEPITQSVADRYWQIKDPFGR